MLPIKPLRINPATNRRRVPQLSNGSRTGSFTTCRHCPAKVFATTDFNGRNVEYEVVKGEATKILHKHPEKVLMNFRIISDGGSLPTGRTR